ncbi:MAG: hypothetical protein K8T89_11930, partial [Planctomycetes bacterium]|nr:hypothetical protein [Planctomycetota bacterium]
MVRKLFIAMLFGAAVTALTVNAQPAPVAKSTTPTPVDVAAKQLLDKQQKLLREYKAITEDLYSLARRFENSDRLADQDKAKLILKAIKLGNDEAVDNKFITLVRTLTGKNGVVGMQDLNDAKNQNDALVIVLREILAIISSDDDMARIKEEKERLEKLLVDLKGLIRQTKVTITNTE